MEAYILNDLLFLVNVTLGDRHVLFGLKVVLGRERVASANSLDCSAV